ncbi:ABC transporter permease [Mycolicibacterium sp. P9-64]|uniref:ABC transporter permease n=1 Tax=Mycolicibacterium sp. P9-64 TaxID=2024612 RepID=UPI0011EBF9C5|nr:ABC transporter permease [Mycolicibacterium sp. P9-64]KAA0084547.1 ABC transporter permease [Mycolicibacterium sp. P9-64]
MSLTADMPMVPPPRSPATENVKTRRRFALGRFVLRRLFAAVITLLFISALIFLATNVLPGDVAQSVLGKNGTPERVALLREQLDLNRPLVSQYVGWLGGMAHGELGRSAVALAQNNADTSVWNLIRTPLMNSVTLSGIAAVLLLPLTLLLGTLAGTSAGKPVDYGISYTALVIGSLPEFVLGTFLILIFFSQLNLLPPVALVPIGASPFGDPSALILPTMTLLGVSLALCLRQVRAGTIETVRQDYVVAARLGGIRERRVLLRYVLRNSLAPSVQAYAQTVQYLFGGIIVVEVLFSYPGIGNALVQAVQTRDTTLVAAIALIIAVFFILINIVADLTVVLLVPKLRTGTM